MVIDFLFSLPLWALAVVLNVWLIGFALVSLWALRRWVLPRLLLNTNASLFYAAAVMQSVMVLYGLVAALTAVSVWSRHAQVSDIVSREATAIASLWRDLGGYPQRERDSMREVLRGYTNQIIQEAWPEQRQGRVPLLSLFFPIEEPRVQAVLVAGLAGFVAMVLFVILSLDRPLQGVMAIPPDSYQLVYDQLMKR